MTRQSRIRYYGTAGLLVIAGAVLGPVIGGETGEVIALVLVGLGLVGLIGIVFYEVGLSEDRDRELERSARARAAQDQKQPRPLERPRLRRLRRQRGERRRLR
jgi:hypothetical protein